MTNRPKAIGTAGETAVLRVILPYFPGAHRNVQHGSRDEGDIWASKDVVFEVKAGAQARQIGDKQLTAWLEQTAEERRNSNAKYGFLVTQRSGFGAQNAARWWAWVPVFQLSRLFNFNYGSMREIPQDTVRLELGELLGILTVARLAGDALR